MLSCPCGTERPFEACCQPFLEGDLLPATAEELMRSRYTAYTRGDSAYISQTWHPDFRDQFSENSSQLEWLGLTVEETEAGGPDDQTGVVQFVARYRVDGQEHEMRERSLFRKEEGRWFYTEANTMQARSKKVGRNEPCPCGSGRKFKKCCALIR